MKTRGRAEEWHVLPHVPTALICVFSCGMLTQPGILLEGLLPHGFRTSQQVFRRRLSSGSSCAQLLERSGDITHGSQPVGTGPVFSLEALLCFPMTVHSSPCSFAPRFRNRQQNSSKRKYLTLAGFIFCTKCIWDLPENSCSASPLKLMSSRSKKLTAHHRKLLIKD